MLISIYIIFLSWRTLHLRYAMVHIAKLRKKYYKEKQNQKEEV